MAPIAATLQFPHLEMVARVQFPGIEVRIITEELLPHLYIHSLGNYCKPHVKVSIGQGGPVIVSCEGEGSGNGVCDPIMESALTAGHPARLPG